MIDFSPMRDGDVTYLEYAARKNIGAKDLRRLSDESVDFLLGLLDGLADADVVFDPEDPDADDPLPSEGEEEIGWNLGHLIAHVTASSEEGAALSSLLARGVPASERPRYETPWHDIKTVAQVRQRLVEAGACAMPIWKPGPMHRCLMFAAWYRSASPPSSAR